MKRPVLIVKSPFFAVLVTVASLALVVSARAGAGRSVIPTASEIAVATWSYSGRSLSALSGLVPQVWRNLTSGPIGTGTLSRSEPGVAPDSSLIEPLEKEPDLQQKIQETAVTTSRLFADTQYAESKISLTELRWYTYTEGEIRDLVQELVTRMGEAGSPIPTTVLGQIDLLVQSWDWPAIADIKVQARAIREALGVVQDEVEASSRPESARVRLGALAGLLDELNDTVGSITDEPSQKTLFGELNKTKQTSVLLENKSQELTVLLADWDNLDPAERPARLTGLAKEVAQVNRIPGVDQMISPVDTDSDVDLKNRGDALLGIVEANKKLLTGKAGAPLVATWLEADSPVVTSLVANPSLTHSQRGLIEYYLPPEVKGEDIIEADPGLSVKYNPERGQTLVSGEFALAPGESRSVSLQVRDVWVIDQGKVAGLRDQAVRLAGGLARTPFSVRGEMVRGDIERSLGQVLAMTTGPDDASDVKVWSSRQAQAQLSVVEGKIGELETLAARASKLGSVFGVGGKVQVLGFGSLTLVLVAGVVLIAWRRGNLTTLERPATVAISDVSEPLSGWRVDLGLLVILALSVTVGLAGGLASGRIAQELNFPQLEVQAQGRSSG